jgi:hypothetical protein
MDGLNEVFNMKFDPKFSIGNLITLCVLIGTIIFSSGKDISNAEINSTSVQKNTKAIQTLMYDNISNQKDLEYIKSQLNKIEGMVSNIAESK